MFGVDSFTYIYNSPLSIVHVINLTQSPTSHLSKERSDLQLNDLTVMDTIPFLAVFPCTFTWCDLFFSETCEALQLINQKGFDWLTTRMQTKSVFRVFIRSQLMNLAKWKSIKNFASA